MKDYAESLSQLTLICKDYQKGILGRITNCGFSLSDSLGASNEYDIRGLIAGLGAQLSDLIILSKKPNKLLSKTTPSERSMIIESLTSINQHLLQTITILDNFQSNNYTVKKENVLSCLDVDGNIIQLPIVNIHTHIDNIKPILRALNLRTDPDRLGMIEEQLAKLQINVTFSESILEEIKGVKSKSDLEYSEILKLITSLEEKYNIYSESVTDLNNKIIELAKAQAETDKLQKDTILTHDSITKTSTAIIEIKSTIMSNEVLVNNFVEKLVDREKQLEQQKVESKAFTERLIEIETEQNDLLAKANSLITDAHKALNLSGTVALGSHFENQYNKSKEYILWWLIAAALFLFCAIGIGVWVLLDNSKITEISFVIARISLMPLAIAGSWFCASQYVKQKRIIENYAYKKVLAHSLVSFKEELQSSDVSDHVKDYLNKVLSEIHKSPLESKQSSEQDKFVTDVMKNIKDSIPDLIKSVIKSGAN